MWKKKVGHAARPLMMRRGYSVARSSHELSRGLIISFFDVVVITFLTISPPARRTHAQPDMLSTTPEHVVARKSSATVKPFSGVEPTVFKVRDTQLGALFFT